MTNSLMIILSITGEFKKIIFETNIENFIHRHHFYSDSITTLVIL